jgi:lysyl-tRNA synthetase class 1
LEEVYFGLRKVTDEKELSKLRGLYEYSWFLKPPPTPGTHIPYNLLVYLVTVAPPEKMKEYVETKLHEYGYLKNGPASDFDERLGYAVNWAKDFREITGTQIDISNPQRLALEDLISIVKSETDERIIQNAIFNLAKKYSLEAPDFFRLLYMILLGSPRGPRLGPYIKAMGSENVARALERATVGSL